MAMPRFDLGGALIEGLQAGQADAMRRRQMDLDEARLRQQMAQEAAREQYEASLRPLRQTQERLSLGGQLIGPIENQEQLDAVRPVLESIQYPLLKSLPQEIRSEAWQTFAKRPGVEGMAPQAPTIAPSWMPQKWATPGEAAIFGSKPILPSAPAEAPLPAGNMVNQADMGMVRNLAQTGLPLEKQERFKDTDLRLAAQADELERRKSKDQYLRDYAEKNFELRRQGLDAATADRETRRILAEKNYGLDVERLGLAKDEAARTADASAPKIPGYEPIPDATVDAASAKVARDAIGKKKSLRDIISEFRSVYSRVKAQGPSARITGGDAQRLNAIRQRMLLNLKEAENLGVLQAVDIQTMEPLVPQAIGVGAMVRGAVGLADPEVALEQFENEVSGRLGNVIESHGYRAIKGGGQAKPTAPAGAPPVSMLKEGVPTGFKNGQVWTLRNGQPVQVK
jgi:hypothetical protein